MVTSFATILVVDDEPDLRTLYELTLLREGYRVETAGTLAEARTQLQLCRFDVLITDMPHRGRLGRTGRRQRAQAGQSGVRTGGRRPQQDR